jgi:type II secretory pathway pseudopilin PulG
MNRGERGAGGVFVAVVLVLVAVGAIAVLALSRATRLVERGDQVAARFATLQGALLQFVTANERLPCPANPALDDGAEAGGGAAGACMNATGTVPWQTIGARRDDGLDPWGQKISYRVYTGAAGSLAQTKGASMVNCDIGDSGAKDPVTGLCVSAPKDTGVDNFLAGKGLSLSDHGTARTDVAYVLVSHGPTGLGSYTANGTQRELPAAGGDERANTEANGPFVIKAFSAAGTDPATAAHFDDFIAYRGIKDLIQAAGVYARQWPEEAATASSSVTFDQSTVETAVGTTVTPGASVGQVSVTFVGAVAGDALSGGIAAEIAFDVVGGYGGIGVAGGGSALIQSSANELFSIAFSESFTKFGITLNDFGHYGGSYFEIVEFRFFLGASEVAGSPRFGVGCNADGGLAAFSGDLGTSFDRIQITPFPAFDAFSGTLTGITALLIAEVKTCIPADATCTTSLATAGNTCTLF